VRSNLLIRVNRLGGELQSADVVGVGGFFALQAMRSGIRPAGLA